VLIFKHLDSQVTKEYKATCQSALTHITTQAVGPLKGKMDKAIVSLVDKALGIKPHSVRSKIPSNEMESAAPIQIFYRNLFNKTIGVMTRADATIGSIKEEIQHQGMSQWQWQLCNQRRQNSSESIPVEEQRLISNGIQLDDLEQTLSQLSIRKGHILDLKCRLRGGAIPPENLSNKGGRLEWLLMIGPDGQEHYFSMSKKDVKPTGTVTYECSQKKATLKNPRPNCTAYAVHEAGNAEITIKRAEHNHPPPHREVCLRVRDWQSHSISLNFQAKTLINIAKAEASTFRDHRISAIVDRVHDDAADSDTEQALPHDKNLGDILRYKRAEESHRELDATPLHLIDLANSELSQTRKGKPYLVYNSTSDGDYQGHRLIWTFISPDLEAVLLQPGAVIIMDASYKMAIGGAREILPEGVEPVYPRNFSQALNIMARVDEGANAGYVHVATAYMSDKSTV
jgi:hypothetical protein